MSTHTLCFGTKLRKIGIVLLFYIKVGFNGVYISQTCFPDIIAKENSTLVLYLVTLTGFRSWERASHLALHACCNMFVMLYADISLYMAAQCKHFHYNLIVRCTNNLPHPTNQLGNFTSW